MTPTTPGGSARVFALHRSDGGVPKLSVREARVTADGMAGDRQRNLKFHGGPERALCLYALERIVALQGEGHPVYPGALGENVTLAGLDWTTVTPGVRLRFGAVLVEVTLYTAPCRTITDSFHDGGFGRVGQKQHPGWSRVYARVLDAGLVRVADPVAWVERVA